MYTSGTKGEGATVPKTTLIYLLISLICALFGAVYELFSHEVYSFYMIYAFAFPLIGGAMPGVILSALHREVHAPALATKLYHSGIATLTVGSIICGILDIYGTTNTLSRYYWYVGIFAVIAGVAISFVRRMHRSHILLLAVLIACQCSVTALAQVTTPPENPLKDKSVLFCGDSICEAICEAPGGKWTTGKAITGWAGRIIENNGMNGANIGKSGASVSTCRGENTIVSQLAKHAASKDNYDFVIMQGGVNDAWDIAPIGEITNGKNDNYDLSTFAGGLENLFRYAGETFPNAKFGFIINFRLPKGSYGKLSDMSEYVDMTIRICEKWEIPYLDLYNNEAINEELKGETTTYLHDYIHPNKAGYDIITPYVEDWMKTVYSDSHIAEPWYNDVYAVL